MRLDVVIPTYNRQQSLSRTLESLERARIPNGLDVSVTVVDNNSTDETRAVVESWTTRLDRLSYVYERRQGRSFALNAGIDATHGELIGFIDDDEEIDESWYETIQHAFTTWDVDFVGGPYIPRWEIAPPAWLPRKYCGVIGDIQTGDEIATFDQSYPGILMGGNAVLTRAILTKVGHYLTSVSRKGKILLAGEDEDMYVRLLEAKARGLYIPGLKIYHHIPAQRLTKQYFRRWCFWRGVSCGVLDRTRPCEAAYLFGVPRYLYGAAARGILGNVASVWRRTEASQRFANELAGWDLAGFFYGKHFYSANET
jgi:glycosyltransferase involved in cell wall biosynthesis